MKIALDVLGGDHAPEANIDGALEYLKAPDSFLDIVLVGNKNSIEAELATKDYDKNKIQIIHTTEIVEMNEKPSRIYKYKPNSSLVKSLDLVKNGDAKAAVSAGNTGALLATSLFLIGKIQGVKRPAFAPFIPSSKGGFILCDAGANANSKPLHLVQFALMAKAYMQYLEIHNNPRVALLNIGKEEGKGNELMYNTYPLLQSHIKNFIGNIESRYLLEGKADIIICDGFTGNIVLKLTEGIITHLMDWLYELFESHFNNENSSTEFLSILKDIQTILDHEEHGATPLLGINGVVMKCHGSATSKGIANSLMAAQKAIQHNLIEDIANQLSEHKNIFDNNIKLDAKKTI